jgi:hypothetical protein
MRLRVFNNLLYFDENLIENFKFIEITAFIWIPPINAKPVLSKNTMARTANTRLHICRKYHKCYYKFLYLHQFKQSEQ